jgi:hypothetical protein
MIIQTPVWDTLSKMPFLGAIAQAQLESLYLLLVILSDTPLHQLIIRT